MLLAAFALTACWAWVTAMAPTTMLAAYSETARNLVWVGVLYRLAGIDGTDEQRGVKPVYAAVACVLGLQLMIDALPLVVDGADRIVWIVGHPVAEDFRVTEPSQGVIFLKARRLGGPG